MTISPLSLSLLVDAFSQCLSITWLSSTGKDFNFGLSRTLDIPFSSFESLHVVDSQASGYNL